MLRKEKHPQKIRKTMIVIGPMPFSWKLVKPHILNKDTQFVFVDGGLTHLKKFKKAIKTPLSMGDGDSSKTPMTFKKTNQNLSDLAFTLNRLTKKNDICSYLFLGFLGGRLDHELFNLGEIAQFTGKMKNKKIVLDNKVEFLPPGQHVRIIHGSFSLGALEATPIKILGECSYPLPKWLTLKTLSSQGLSNEGLGRIEIHTKKVLMLFKDSKSTCEECPRL